MKPEISTVLIVDDEPDVCWALERLLSNKGFSVTKVISGREALRLVGKRSFEWIFVDAKLPDAEGLELARQFGTISPGTRTVMVSGFYYKDDAAVLKALESGLIFAFIAKPFQNNEVLRLVDIDPS